MGEHPRFPGGDVACFAGVEPATLAQGTVTSMTLETPVPRGPWGVRRTA